MKLKMMKVRGWMGICVAALALSQLVTVQQALAVRIRDVARLKTDVPNELVGMGLVVGLKGTGDGGDYLPAMRPLKEMMKRFDDPVRVEEELKNANNVAIVSLSLKVPVSGARAGEKLTVQVSSIGAAKSLKGGRLIVSPLLAPRTDVKIVLASASGDLTIDDPTNPTTASIRDGGVLIEDFLPEEIKDGKFTLVLHPNTATMETATAVADRINEEVAAQTDGQPMAVAVDATSVDVKIPKVELANTTAFIARIRSLPLPNISEPAKVLINTQTKTIVYTDEVEIAPTTITQRDMTVSINPAPAAAGANGLPATTASMRDLENAFNLMKVSPDDRIAIVKSLYEVNALKADLQVK